MSIADLYDADLVVVGQAAVFFAAGNTPLPALSAFNIADPFALAPWGGATITFSAGTAAGTLTAFGEATSSLLGSTATATSIQTALNTATADQGITWVVTANGSVSMSYIATPLGNTVPLVMTSTPSVGTIPIVNPQWVPCGATDQGWQFGTNKSTQDITIEEQSTPVFRTITSQSVTLNGGLSEEITSNLALAYNGIATTVAATSTTPGYDEVNLTDDVLTYAVGMVAARRDGKPRIIYAPLYTQLSNVQTDFRRASAKHIYPVSFGTICKPSQIRVITMTTPKTP